MTEAQSSNVKQMQAPAPTGVRMIKMKVNLACMVEDRIAQPGEEIEVDEARAKELEKVIEGGYSLAGELGQDQAESLRHRYKRASRI